MTLKQKNTLERNSKIRQLRGILPRLTQLIPEDVAKLFGDSDMIVLRRMQYELIELLNNVKKKNFTCPICNDVSRLRKTKSKRAITCDYCGKYAVDSLYIVKK